MDREAWRAVIHGVTKSRTQLRDWTELFVIMLSNLFLIQSLWSNFLSPFDSRKTYTHKS